MGNTPEYVLLGLLQGLTEFLPVSSSGHLAVAEKWLGVPQAGLLTSTCLHFGTLLAVLFVFRRQVRELVVDGTRGALLTLRGRSSDVATRAPQFPLAMAVVVGTIPAVLAGLSLKLVGTDALQNTRLVGVMLVVTGLILIAARFAPAGSATHVGPRRGLAIGVAQAFALLPGISRSGTTIVAGYYAGLSRETAARFSFLLAVPAILGAMAAEVGSHVLGRPAGDGAALTAGEALGLGLGTATASLVGYVCLRLLFAIVRKGELHWFAAYCIPVGLAVVLTDILGAGGGTT